MSTLSPIKVKIFHGNVEKIEKELNDFIKEGVCLQDTEQTQSGGIVTITIYYRTYNIRKQ